MFEKTAIFPIFHISNKPEIQVVQHLFKTLDLLERAKLFIKETRIKISLIQELSGGLVLYKTWLSILMDRKYIRKNKGFYQ